ncbi:MAG: acyl-CoA dehydrogenase [Chloroflexi bacterium]|nr:acyl-CoA dehydrogenase [Chloroflexota bacterium]
MVAFTPTEEQQQLIDTIRRFAINDIQPMAHEADENERIPAAIIKTGWDIGLVQTAIPEELGGLGEMSAVTGVLAAEAFAYGDVSTAMQIMAPALFAYPVILYGTAEQREQFLPLFLEDQVPHVSAALLEPGIFFDAHALKTTATIEGSKIKLNGEKAYVPLGATADWLLVYARDVLTNQTDAYLVEAATPGVTIGKREALMGIRALPTYRVTFANAEIEASARLGGAVGCNIDMLLQRSQIALAALAVGVADAAAEYARNYAKQRIQFGVPIAQKQAIAFMLAEMAIEVDAARLMTWEAAWKLDEGQDASKEVYLAKQYADKAALFVTDSAVQTLGGHGFIREYPVERWLRNARGFTTFHGMAIV